MALAAPEAVRILDAAGYDLVIVETVGVGQAEVEVAAATDTALVVLAPGLGDAVQMAKAGILEVADVFVVNKADRDGAAAVVRELQQMLRIGAHGDWEPPVLAHHGDQRRGHGRAVVSGRRAPDAPGVDGGGSRREARAPASRGPERSRRSRARAAAAWRARRAATWPTRWRPARRTRTGSSTLLGRLEGRRPVRRPGIRGMSHTRWIAANGGTERLARRP